MFDCIQISGSLTSRRYSAAAGETRAAGWDMGVWDAAGEARAEGRRLLCCATAALGEE